MPRLLQDAIRTVADNEAELEPEDIFAAAPAWLFPDDCLNSHGDPGATLVYTCPQFGEIRLRTADPSGERERQLFAHYLWNAELRMAMLIGEESKSWSVKNEVVLELGAGAGLAGIISSLAGAKEVVLSDYPSEAVLEITRQNVRDALPQELTSRYQVQGYQWGDVSSAFATSRAGSFSRILAADCYWMPGEHENLAISMLHFLDAEPSSRVLMIAGFHTGRAKLSNFFDVAVEYGLEVEDIYEEDAEGETRPWAKERDGGTEHHRERKRWQVIAQLKRRATTAS